MADKFLEKSPMPVKVAQVTTVDMTLRYVLLCQLRDLKRRGYEIAGISTPSSDGMVLCEEGIRLIALTMTRRITPIRDLISLCRLVHVMRREQFSIVHTHTPKANLLGQCAARLANVPVRIATVHGLLFTERTPLLKRWCFEVIERLSALWAHRVFLINKDDLETVLKRRIVKEEQIFLLPAGLGVDVELFDPWKVSTLAIQQRREALGIPEHCKVIGFVGRLVVEKGVLDLFEAVVRVSAVIKNLRVLFIGPVDDAKADAVEPGIAAHYGLSKICVFAGLQDDMPECYALMDVLVLPSHREGQPRVTMEASAMGLPCIGTDIRGIREQIKHRKNGLLVPPGNPDALAEALLDVLSDPEAARRLGDEGRRIALERFDQRTAFESVHRQYARLLSQNGVILEPMRQTADTA
jgi:glycosyltransferase involved in cell wall biosynthesis